MQGLADGSIYLRDQDSFAATSAQGPVTGTEPDIEGHFAAGNYVATVMADRRDDWRTYAALGLIGKTEAALQGLGRFDDAGARFYAAAASWIAGDERIAADILEEIPTPHARNLLALIRKPQIHVLAQLPWTRKGPQDLLGGAAEDGKFVVRNISFDSHDLGNEPYADVHRYYDQRIPPDFYICAMAEWHLVPPNVQELPCPILGQTADYDLHIQTVYPWLQVFDAMVVTDHTEWHDVHRLTSVPVVTLPKSFVLPEGLQPIPRSHRKYDVLQTGTVTHPYYPDKGELLHQILADPRRAVLCVNGFLDDGAYHALLASAKVVPTYVRHSGALPTRGLEALSMGCVVAVQRGSALTLYAGEEEGVVTYDLTQRDLPSVINRVVGSWPEYERRARRGAGIVRREFRKERVASQYLRFLTVLAAQPRVGRRSARTEELDQRRRILRKGWVPGDRNVLEKVQEKNLAHLRAKAQHAPSARVFNDMARELILSHAVDAGDSAGSPVAEEVVSQILRFYRAAVDRFPASLVLRFNLVRSALHFGQPNEVSEALALAEETLHQPSSDWQVDVLEDVFPWDFANTFFNYRAYFDSATEHLASGKSATEDLARLILASLHYYLAHYSLSLEHYRAAATLDAEFPYYTLRYAHALLRANDTESRREAKRFLWQLARHSILFVDACAMLESLAVAEGSDPDVKVLRAVQDRAAESIKITEPLLAFPLRPARVQLDARTGAQDIATSTTIDGREAPENPQPSQVRPASRKDYLVSALVTTYNAERFMGALLEDLEAQTIADRLEIVIVDSASPEDERAIVDEFRRSYDNIVYLRTDERENSHVALNRAIRMARGRYLTLANADDRHRPDAFERMTAILESQPGVALVYADSAITEQANGALASSRIIGHLRLPDWDPRVLFRGCCIGPQPMWRRELHDKYGFFDPEFEICGDYEFWLRTGVRETFHHIPDVLGLYFMSSTSNERVNGIRRHQETERARRKHWPKNWGELPPWDSDYNVMDNTNGKAPLQAPPPLAADSVPAAVSGLDGVAVGQAALERHAWADACDGFIRALEQDPACGIARSGLGLALMALGDAEEGFAQLQEGVRLSPTPDAVCNLACGLIHVGRHAEARQLLEGILTVTPTHEASRANLETLSGVPEDRMTSDQGDGSPNVRLSAVLESAAGHLAHKRWPEAVTAFREVLRQAPDLAEARAALGSALLVIGRTEEAIPELRVAAAALDTSRAWNDLGWACAVGGHVEDARATLVTAIERDPTNLEPQRNLAALFETLDMRQEAAAAYDLILLTAPGDAEAKKGKMRCGETTATSGPAVDVAGELAVTHG